MQKAYLGSLLLVMYQSMESVEILNNPCRYAVYKAPFPLGTNGERAIVYGHYSVMVGSDKKQKANA